MLKDNIDGVPMLQEVTDSEQAVSVSAAAVEMSPPVSPVDLWIQKNPGFRQNEIDYLRSANLGFDFSITHNGDLHQPFAVLEKWIFLLVLDKSFPRETEDRDFPVKVYFVKPSIEEFQKECRTKKKPIPSVKVDASGMPYLSFRKSNKELELYVNGRSDKLMTETMIHHTREWAVDMLEALKSEQKPNQRSRISLRNSFWTQESNPGYEDDYYPLVGTRSKYVDGRASYTDYVNPKCRKVVLSDRALIQIYNESRSRIETETGGLLLGHYEDGVWYVIEASDPGINAKFYNSYHEGDDVYENHVCGVISRIYKHPLVFLGMWHRHPGSLDRFSDTDDRTNCKYAASAGNGCISAIINYDPEFRITFYYAEQQGEHCQMSYTKVDVEVGNDKITNKEMMMLATIEDVKSRMRKGGMRSE